MTDNNLTTPQLSSDSHSVLLNSNWCSEVWAPISIILCSCRTISLRSWLGKEAIRAFNWNLKATAYNNILDNSVLSALGQQTGEVPPLFQHVHKASSRVLCGRIWLACPIQHLWDEPVEAFKPHEHHFLYQPQPGAKLSCGFCPLPGAAWQCVEMYFGVTGDFHQQQIRETIMNTSLTATIKVISSAIITHT